MFILTDVSCGADDHGNDRNDEIWQKAADELLRIVNPVWSFSNPPPPLQQKQALKTI